MTDSTSGDSLDDLVNQVSRGISGNSICKFEIGDDVLLIKPSETVGVHINSESVTSIDSPYNTTTEENDISEVVVDELENFNQVTPDIDLGEIEIKTEESVDEVEDSIEEKVEE